MLYSQFEFKQLTRNLFRVIAVRDNVALLENQILESLNSYTHKPLQTDYYEIFRQNRPKVNQFKKGWVYAGNFDIKVNDIFVGRISNKLQKNSTSKLIKIEKRLPRIDKEGNYFELSDTRILK